MEGYTSKSVTGTLVAGLFLIEGSTCFFMHHWPLQQASPPVGPLIPLNGDRRADRSITTLLFLSL